MTQDKRKVLGRGLDSLIPAARSTAAAPAATGTAAGIAAAASAPAGEVVREIALEQIERNPYQTREQVDDDALAELAASIATQGVLQPIVVRPIRPEGASGGNGVAERFQLIAGQRRCMASQRAGKKTVPAIVRQVSNEQAMEMTIVENLQREDLNPMEQARAFDRLGREFNLTQEEMAARTGKTRSSIANYLRLLRMPEIVQNSITKGELSFGHAKVLLRLGTAQTILKLAEKIVHEGWSVRQAEEWVDQFFAPPADKPQAEERRVDPNVRAAERTLEESLGVRVRIRDRQGRGTIVIEYKSLEDFDRVVEVLGRK
jgi:ParB family chromosome partitioning protein